MDRIHRLVTSGLLGSLDMTTLTVYEPCLKGKMTLKPFQGKKVKRPKRYWIKFTQDLCEPMKTRARGNNEYFNYSRKGYIYLMYHKSEVFD